jgi:hypothetical protein
MNKSPEDERLWKEFRQYFTAFVVNDVKKSLEIGIEVGTIILTTIGIECLGGYYAGKETKREHFVKFMQDFMPEYGNLADDIYECIRNGLAHDYVVKENKKNQRKFILTRNQGEQHLSSHPLNPNVFYLNRETYARDFLKIQRAYFEKVDNDQSLWDKAMQRLHSQKGFLTVRPENEFVSSSGEVHYPGTLPNPSTTSYPTGTSTQPPDGM